MPANSSLITTCGPNATVSSSVRGRVYRPAGLADTTLVRPTRRSVIRPARERRLTSRWTVVSGAPTVTDSSVMLYSVSGWRRSSVRSSACGWDRRIGMRAGASARIDGRYHPFKGMVKACGRGARPPVGCGTTPCPPAQPNDRICRHATPLMTGERTAQARLAAGVALRNSRVATAGLAARPGLLPDVSRTLAGRPDSGPYRQVGQPHDSLGAGRMRDRLTYRSMPRLAQAR